MPNLVTREGLLATLTERYETDPGQFVSLPREILDSSSTRLALAELRNAGYVEEQSRGVVRLTTVGYLFYKKHGSTPWPEALLRFAV